MTTCRLCREPIFGSDLDPCQVTVETARITRGEKGGQIRKAKGSLAAYVGDAQKGSVVFTVKGDPVAALVPVTNADLETVSLGSNRRFLRLIGRSRRAWETEEDFPPPRCGRGSRGR